VAITYAWLWYSLTVLKNPLLCVVVYHPVLCLAGGLLIRKLSPDFPKSEPRINFKFSLILTLIIVLFSTMVLIVSAMFVLQPSMADPQIMTDGLSSLGMDRAHFWIIGGWIMIINPFAEEFFWRTSVLRFLSGRMSRTLAIGVMAALFAGYHPLITMMVIPSGWLPFVFVLTFIGGLVLGELYLRSRKIIWSIIVHLVMNINLMLIGWQHAPG